MLTVEIVEAYIDEKLGEVYFLGKEIEVTLPEEPSDDVLQKVISRFRWTGLVYIGRSGSTIHLTTVAALS